MFGRGLTKRCPVCGHGRLFKRWVNMVEDCPRCRLHFERIEGHWIGAVAMNTVVSFGLLLVTIVVGLVLSLPDPKAAPLLIAALGVALVTPIAFYPFSKTLWTAIDVSMRPLEPGEVHPDWLPLGDS